LAGCWIFNEAAGEKVMNHGDAGAQYDGTFAGSPEWKPGGMECDDQTQQCLSCGTYDIGTGAQSWTWYVNILSVPAADWRHIWAKGDAWAAGQMRWEIWMESGGNIGIDHSTGGDCDWPSSDGRLLGLHIFTITFAGDGETPILYIDGVSFGDADETFTCGTGGTSLNTLGKFDGFNGSLNCIWNAAYHHSRMLSAAEVALLHREPYCMFSRPIVVLPAPSGVAAPLAITIQDAIHGHLSDVAAETRLRTLTTQSSIHGHLADTPTLSKERLLTLQDAIHGHLADAIAPTRQRTLSLQEPVHSHLADSVLLSLLRELAVQDAVHGHLASKPLIAKGRLLTVRGAVHGHLASKPLIVKGRLLTVQEAVHGHLASKPNLARLRTLIIQEALHGTLSDVLALTTAGLRTLTVQDSVHGHLATVPAVSAAAVGIAYPRRIWAAETTAFNFAAKECTYITAASMATHIFSAKKDK
jgi:hypothetical protein